MVGVCNRGGRGEREVEVMTNKERMVAVEKQLRYLRRKAEKRAMKEGVVTTEPLGEKPKPGKPAIADGGKEMKRWKV